MPPDAEGYLRATRAVPTGDGGHTRAIRFDRRDESLARVAGECVQVAIEGRV